MARVHLVILAINLLFLIWLIAGLAGAGEAVKDCASLVGQAARNCRAGNTGTAVGASIGAAIIIGLWAFVDVILGVLWLVTRRRTPRAQAPPLTPSG